KKFIDCFLLKFLESVQHNLTPQIIRGFLHFKVLDLLASQIQTIVECFPELGDSVNDISVAIKDFPILEQDILRKEIHRLSTKVWNLSKDTNQLIDIYVRLTCFLFALDQSAKFLFLNAELKNEIKNRSDCTHSLAKFIFNSSRDASDSTNIYKLFESQFKRQHNDYAEFNFSPKLPPSVTLHELQAAKRGQNNIISLLGSLYSSEDQFIHEFNSIFFKFLMKNALELNHKTLVELWDLVNQVKEEFNNENIVKSLTMLQDVQSSLNYSTFCAEKTKFVEFPIQIYIVSHNYWPIISKYQKTLPPIVGPL
ncbi:MAG: Anaphase-promoting complex subunit 2, partial [Marteilia pararefringens]